MTLKKYFSFYSLQSDGTLGRAPNVGPHYDPIDLSGETFDTEELAEAFLVEVAKEHRIPATIVILKQYSSSSH